MTVELSSADVERFRLSMLECLKHGDALLGQIELDWALRTGKQPGRMKQVAMKLVRGDDDEFSIDDSATLTLDPETLAELVARMDRAIAERVFYPAELLVVRLQPRDKDFDVFAELSPG